jgi:hypothetical protein
MRSSFPTREELSTYSITKLRLIDIHEKDEEELIQEILNAKLAVSPLEQPVYVGDIPDIKTPEEEAKWQKIVDERTAAKRPTIFQQTVENIESEEVVNIDNQLTPENSPEVIQETPVQVEEEEIEMEGLTVKCLLCGAKTKRHKKECPTLLKA